MMMTASVPAPMYTGVSFVSVARVAVRYPFAAARKRAAPAPGPRAVYSSRMSERERRIGENESYWRQVNELAPPHPGMLSEVFCECGRLECRERVSMTASEYASVRARSTTFVVVPGHEIVDAERVIQTTERYSVVEKDGEAARIAVERDV